MKKIILSLIVVLAHFAFADHSGEKDHSHHDQIIEKSVKVEIGKDGFEPESELNFMPNETIVLNITRTTDTTCMKKIMHPKTGKLVTLPMNKEVRLEVSPYKEPTDIKLLCGMGMKAGVIHIKEKS